MAGAGAISRDRAGAISKVLAITGDREMAVAGLRARAIYQAMAVAKVKIKESNDAKLFKKEREEYEKIRICNCP